MSRIKALDMDKVMPLAQHIAASIKEYKEKNNIQTFSVAEVGHAVLAVMFSQGTDQSQTLIILDSPSPITNPPKTN